MYSPSTAITIKGILHLKTEDTWFFNFRVDKQTNTQRRYKSIAAALPNGVSRGHSGAYALQPVEPQDFLGLTAKPVDALKMSTLENIRSIAARLSVFALSLMARSSCAWLAKGARFSSAFTIARI